jgi:hypothetical protein
VGMGLGLACGCRRGEFLCDEAVRLWQESSRTWEEAYGNGWYGVLPSPAAVERHEQARATYDAHFAAARTHPATDAASGRRERERT